MFDEFWGREPGSQTENRAIWNRETGSRIEILFFSFFLFFFFYRATGWEAIEEKAKHQPVMLGREIDLDTVNSFSKCLQSHFDLSISRSMPDCSTQGKYFLTP